jgi:hypothetical protein
MYNGSIKNKQKSFSSVLQEGQEKRTILVAAGN